MYCGIDATEVALPVTVRLPLPTVLMNVVGIVAENCTLDVTVPELLTTDTVRLSTVKPVWPAMLPLKMLVASATPAAIGPSDVIDPAARKAGELFAIEPTLAASRASCNRVRIL